MWNKPWGMKEGFAIGIALIVIGLVLQFSIGAVEWGLLRWPVNIIILVVFVVTAVVLFFLRSKVHALRYFATLPCAVPALGMGNIFSWSFWLGVRSLNTLTPSFCLVLPLSSLRH